MIYNQHVGSMCDSCLQAASKRYVSGLEHLFSSIDARCEIMRALRRCWCCIEVYCASIARFIMCAGVVQW